MKMGILFNSNFKNLKKQPIGCFFRFKPFHNPFACFSSLFFSAIGFSFYDDIFLLKYNITAYITLQFNAHSFFQSDLNHFNLNQKDIRAKRKYV